TNFIGYGAVDGSGHVLALVAAGDSISEAAQGQDVQIALDSTPFYAESGGQVGDTGLIVGPYGRVQVNDTQRPVPGVIVHYGTVIEGRIAVGDAVETHVDRERRLDVMRNHTATHMLHRALRDVVGEHAAQAGSLVAPDRLRFDFTHGRQVSAEQLREIERRINSWVRADTPVEWNELGYQEALNEGAMALFGEKYGDRVRMVTVGCDDEPGSYCSRELCGGTHVARTGQIGIVRLVSETSVAAGTRRIEAVTGIQAERWVDEQATALRTIAGKLGVPAAQAAERVEALLDQLRQTQRELEQIQTQAARGSLEGLLQQQRQTTNGIPFVYARVDAPDANRLREMGDWLRDKIGSGVIVLGAAMADKAQLLAMVTPDLVKRGIHAGNLVKALAP
ncbi:MAG TPA: alanine--tRNA ligase-related protein, partial [Roseiflexaceae bacterium]|nr:alanine--tRNA ligase-related protein [Roseiflexaceae bacterium]